MSKQRKILGGLNGEKECDSKTTGRCAMAQAIQNSFESGTESHLKNTQKYEISDKAAKWLHDSGLVTLEVEKHD